MAVKKIAAIDRYSGLEADIKPTGATLVGSTFQETDTGNVFAWNGSTWISTFPSIDVHAHGALVTVSHLMHEVHEAHNFTGANAESMASGSVSSILFETPGSAVSTIHMLVNFGSTGAGTLIFAEGEVGTAGTLITPQNNHRPTGGSSDLITISNTAAATVGTVLEYAVIGTAAPPTKIGGQFEGGNEWILNHSTRYLLQFTSSAATSVSWGLSWIEEPA